MKKKVLNMLFWACITFSLLVVLPVSAFAEKALPIDAAISRTSEMTVSAKISNCYYTQGKVMTTINYNYVNSDCTVFLSIFKNNGRLLKSVSQPVLENALNTVFEVAVDENSIGLQVKAVFIDSVSNLKPLGEAVSGIITAPPLPIDNIVLLDPSTIDNITSTQIVTVDNNNIRKKYNYDANTKYIINGAEVAKTSLTMSDFEYKAGTPIDGFVKLKYASKDATVIDTVYIDTYYTALVDEVNTDYTIIYTDVKTIKLDKKDNEDLVYSLTLNGEPIEVKDLKKTMF